MNYPHPYLTVCLLDECNRACKHCYRTAIPSGRGFRLSGKQALACLDDATSLGTACMFGGGEPTIWHADDMDFPSALMRAANQNGHTAFLSNGHVFEDRDYAYEFVRRYASGCTRPLRMMFSVDSLHANYDATEKRIPFLDKLIAARDACSARKVISLFLLSHWTLDENLNIPLHVFERYAEEGVRYQIDDFVTWGRAADVANLACYVQVGSAGKASLGPYRQILTQRMIAAGTIENEREFEQLGNRDLLRRLSVCGRSPNFFVSWGPRYYYCIPHMGHDWFSISEIGRLSTGAIESFFATRPVIKEIHELSIFGLLEKYEGLVPDGLFDEIDVMRESIRFAGCSVCLRLHRDGLLEKINRKILGK